MSGLGTPDSGSSLLHVGISQANSPGETLQSDPLLAQTQGGPPGGSTLPRGPPSPMERGGGQEGIFQLGIG